METATTRVLRMLTRKTSRARMARTEPQTADEPTLLMARRMYSALLEVGMMLDLGDVPLDLGDLLQDALGDVDRVLARLLVDGQAHPLPVVDAGDAGDALERVVDAGDLLELDGHAVPDGDDRVPELVQAGEDAGDAEEDLVVAPLDDPGRHVDVLLADLAGDDVEGQAEGLELEGIEVDLDLPLTAAGDVDGGDPGHALEPVGDLLVDDAPGLDGIEVAEGPELQDRLLGRVELAQGRPVDLVGQAADDPVEALPDVVGRGVEVGPPGEHDPDGARAFRRRGEDLLDPGHGAQGLLDRPGDDLLDLLGPRVRVGGVDVEGGIDDLGHEVDGQAGERDEADDDDDERHHPGEDGPADGEFGELHRLSPGAFFLAGRSGGPGRALRAG